MISVQSSVKRNLWLAVIALIYVLINSFLIYKGYQFGYFVPVIFAFLILGLFSLNNLFYTVVFFTPLSIPLSFFFRELSFDLALPTEPILAGIMLLFILKWGTEKIKFQTIFRNPITIIILIQMAWMLFTSITSTMPLVSLKYILARTWFITGFFLLSLFIFTKTNQFYKAVWIYIVALLFVIIYSWIRMSAFGFQDQIAANKIVHPFYNDHTAYGAALAMLIPVAAGMFIIYKSSNKWIKVLVGSTIAILLVALLLSYSRAAWLSAAASFIVFIIVVLKIKLRYLIGTAIIAISFLCLFWTDIVYSLEKNNQDSSRDMVEHMKSIGNISSDDSNLERINRWNSALEMFKIHPVLGWGPGTYTFQYAPYQSNVDRTNISTNAGDLGNAHSEYFSALTETGLPGMIIFIILVIFVIYRGIRLYHSSLGLKTRIACLSAVLGLITYYVHGLLNNFLDTDKLSALFWIYTALIVTADIRLQRKTKVKKTELPTS